ncbi:kinase-like domain-containing protein [Colletotrichum cereale]|nr:kinase-like domain-containing protein [Colletotrichum cereale]
MYVKRLLLLLDCGPNSPFTPRDAHTILVNVSSALAYLVTCDVVHNDIKPANIAYLPARGAVLLDFGLATAANAPTMLGGTLWYVSPNLITRQT